MKKVKSCKKEGFNDKKLALKHSFYCFLEFLSDELKNDKEIVSKAVDFLAENFKFINEDLKNDKDFVCDLLVNNLYVFGFLSEEPKNDTKFILKVPDEFFKSVDYPSYDENIYEDLPDVLKNDAKFIRFLFYEKNYLKFLPNKRNDKEFILEDFDGFTDIGNLELIDKDFLKIKILF